MSLAIYDIDDLIMDGHCIEASHQSEIIDLTISDDESSDDELPSLWSLIHEPSIRQGVVKRKPASDALHEHDPHQEDRPGTASGRTESSASRTSDIDSSQSQDMIPQNSVSYLEHRTAGDKSDFLTSILAYPQSQDIDSSVTHGVQSVQQYALDQNINTGFDDEERSDSKRGIEDCGGGASIEISGGNFLGVHGEREAVQGCEYPCLVGIWLRPENGAPCQQIREYKADTIRQARIKSLRKRERKTGGCRCTSAQERQILAGQSVKSPNMMCFANSVIRFAPRRGISSRALCRGIPIPLLT